MKTNHVNVPQGGQVYCYRMNAVVGLTTKFMMTECAHCPYYNGDSQGRGVECKFDDACGAEERFFYTPADSEKHSISQYVRLGMKTQSEVDAMLQTQQVGENLPPSKGITVENDIP